MDPIKEHAIALYCAWYDWFFTRWERGEGLMLGGRGVVSHVIYAEYNGFGGEF